MVTFETVLDVVPAVSVAVALVYYGLQIRNQNKARQAQLYAQIYDEPLYRQFKDTMSSLEAIAVSDWPLPEKEIAPYVEVGEIKTDGTILKTKLNEDTQK